LAYGSFGNSVKHFNMNKFGLHGQLNAQEGKVEELEQILLKAAELVSKAQGCHLYQISRDEKTPHSVWITEIWDSSEDHKNSLKDEQVRALIGTAIPLLDGQPQGGQQLEAIGGFGLD